MNRYPVSFQLDPGCDVPVKLTLPDGSVREYPDGVTGLEVAMDIGARLAKAAVAVAIDGSAMDLSRPIDRDGKFAVLTEDS